MITILLTGAPGHAGIALPAARTGQDRVVAAPGGTAFEATPEALVAGAPARGRC